MASVGAPYPAVQLGSRWEETGVYSLHHRSAMRIYIYIYSIIFYIHVTQIIVLMYIRRKFRSETSDNMDS